jgi:hypothetical protein
MALPKMEIEVKRNAIGSREKGVKGGKRNCVWGIYILPSDYFLDL